MTYFSYCFMNTKNDNCGLMGKEARQRNPNKPLFKPGAVTFTHKS